MLSSPVWFYFPLPGLAERTGVRVTASREARERFLRFAASGDARWPGKFRNLSAAVARRSALAGGGRISTDEVDGEIQRLRTSWDRPALDEGEAFLKRSWGRDARRSSTVSTGFSWPK